MKFFRTCRVFVLFVSSLVLCCGIAFADDPEIISDILVNDESSYRQDLPDYTEYLQQIVDTIKESPENGKIEIEPTQTVELTQLRISPSDTSGLHAIVLSLIGDYNPIVKDYTYTSSQGYTSHSIDIEPDYSWIASAVIFLVVIYCCFRIFGLIFSR